MPLSDAYRGIAEELSETVVEDEVEQEHMTDSTGVRRGTQRVREESEEPHERQVRPRDEPARGQESVRRVDPRGTRRVREESEEPLGRQIRPRDESAAGQASAQRGDPDEPAVGQASAHGVDPDDQEPCPSGDPDPNGESGEARDPHYPPVPRRPTAIEIHQHRVAGHLPYRNWCDACVRGKCKNTPHRRVPRDEQPGLPYFHFDYCFIRNDGDQDTMSVLMLKDEHTRMLFLHLVPEKGADVERMSEIVASGIKDMGYKRVATRSDQEERVLVVLAEKQRDHGVQVVPTNSPLGESQSNGVAERGVQTGEDQVRVLKLALGSRLNGQIAMDHPIMSWLAAYAGWIVSRQEVGYDGRTSYERWRGRPYRGELMDFCSMLLSSPIRSRGKHETSMGHWYLALQEDQV